MSRDSITTHTVSALNLSAASENRIHDDAVAKRFGFSGGLVPGVEVYAYMLNPVVRRFGVDWLRGGSASVRLQKPVYDGRQVTVTATADDAGGLALTAESDGVLCAAGTAGMDSRTTASAPDRFATAPLPDPDQRPEAAPETLPDGRVLGTVVQDMDQAGQEQYLRDIRETVGLYAAERIVHPGWLLKMANRALSANVRLGPWMHVGSAVTNLAPARYGDRLGARGRVRRSYERKGHLFVDIDVLIVRDDGTAIQAIDHVAIYRPRQVRQAA